MLNVNVTFFRILSQCDTLYDLIWDWIIFGYLKDPKSNDFFINEDEDGQIKFDLTKAPEFIHPFSVSKIHFTGQSVRTEKKSELKLILI